MDWSSGYFLRDQRFCTKILVGSQILYKNSRGVTDFSRHSTQSNLHRKASKQQYNIIISTLDHIFSFGGSEILYITFRRGVDFAQKFCIVAYSVWPEKRHYPPTKEVFLNYPLFVFQPCLLLSKPDMSLRSISIALSSF